MFVCLKPFDFIYFLMHMFDMFLRSGFFLSLTASTCCFQLDELLKSQIEHLCGFFPSWTDAMCKVKLLFLEKLLSHKSHLKFLQENDMCTPEEKAEIVGKVKAIYKLVTIWHNSNKDVS